MKGEEDGQSRDCRRFLRYPEIALNWGEKLPEFHTYTEKLKTATEKNQAATGTDKKY